MKTFALTVMGMLACAGFASAGSDKDVLPVAPALAPECSWTGFYLGAKLGGGWTGNNSKLSVERFNNNICLAPNPLTPNSEKVEPGGLIGGGDIGYNYEFWRYYVVGVEADIFGSNMAQGAVTAVQDANFAASLSSKQEIDWFGTVRGRVGVLASRKVLLYGTAGFAYADIKDTANEVGSFFEFPASSTTTQTGWAAGGGVEIAINCHWSVKAEYLYFDVGQRTITGNLVETLRDGIGGSANQYTFEGTFHTVTAGLNYKF